MTNVIRSTPNIIRSEDRETRSCDLSVVIERIDASLDGPCVDALCRFDSVAYAKAQAIHRAPIGFVQQRRRRTHASTEANRLTYFHFDIGGRARNAGRFIGKVRNEFLRALSVKRAEAGICQQALATKLDAERALINRQLSGEETLSLRSLADLAWAMDMEISFELKSPSASPGQNHPMTTSTVSYGQIKYLDGGARKVSNQDTESAASARTKKSA